MIEYIKGDLAELTPAMAVIEAAGVGYALNISLNTYTAIQGKDKVKLFVHEARRFVHALWVRHAPRARTLSLAYQRFGRWSQFGTHDSFGNVARRTVQRHCRRRRQDAENR